MYIRSVADAVALILVNCAKWLRSHIPNWEDVVTKLDPIDLAQIFGHFALTAPPSASPCLEENLLKWASHPMAYISE